MGYKSRGNWAGACIRNCKNRDKKCDDCIRFSEYKEDEREQKKGES